MNYSFLRNPLSKGTYLSSLKLRYVQELSPLFVGLMQTKRQFANIEESERMTPCSGQAASRCLCHNKCWRLGTTSSDRNDVKGQSCAL